MCRITARPNMISALIMDLEPSILINRETLLLAYAKTKAHMSRVMRKPDFCICENKDADQLRGNREADQRLCFCYTDSTIPLLPTSEISNL